jgi:hypothetical protein
MSEGAAMNNYQATASTRVALDSAGLKGTVILRTWGCLTQVLYVTSKGTKAWYAETITLANAMENLKDEDDFLDKMKNGPFDKLR